MDIVKKILVFGLGLAFIAAAIWYLWLKEQVAFAQLATAYTAKQVCSCRFVSERPMASCIGDFTDDISALTITELDQAIRSQAPLGMARDTAQYNAATGCVLVSS